LRKGFSLHAAFTRVFGEPEKSNSLLIK